ncbi:unnamed protein product [Urochloa humidicola]
MGPGRGVSPSVASRFVGTRSEGGPRLMESSKVRLQRSFDEADKLHKELDEARKATWLCMDERKRAVDNLRKLGEWGCTNCFRRSHPSASDLVQRI